MPPKVTCPLAEDLFSAAAVRALSGTRSTAADPVTDADLAELVALVTEATSPFIGGGMRRHSR
jgi:hypothetical protein